MIDKKEIEAFVEEGLTGSDCFVVDVQVTVSYTHLTLPTNREV